MPNAGRNGERMRLSRKSSHRSSSPCGCEKAHWNTDYSSDPAITTDSDDHILVVWSDESSGNFEIYYKKGIQ